MASSTKTKTSHNNSQNRKYKKDKIDNTIKTKLTRQKYVIYATEIGRQITKIIEFHPIYIGIDWKKREKKMSGRGGHGGGIGIFVSVRRRGGYKTFNSSNNRNKRQDLKFIRMGMDRINIRRGLLK